MAGGHSRYPVVERSVGGERVVTAGQREHDLGAADTFDQGDQRGPVPGPDDQVAFPVSELATVLDLGGTVMNRGEGTQDVSAGLGSTLVAASATVPAGAQHFGGFNFQQSPVDALVDRFGGDPADQMRGACRGVPGSEMAGHLGCQFGFCDEPALTSGPLVMSGPLRRACPVAVAATVGVDIALDRGPVSTQDPAQLGPRDHRVLSQAPADLLAFGQRQARVGHDGNLQQSVRWVSDPTIMAGHRALAAGTRRCPRRARLVALPI